MAEGLAEAHSHFTGSEMKGIASSLRFGDSNSAYRVVHTPTHARSPKWCSGGSVGRVVGVGTAASVATLIDDALERHNEYANSKPIDPSKQKNRMPGEGPRDKLTTGLDTRTVAVLSHDDTGQALHIWMAHQLKALVGSGSPPKVIRDLFINTGAPSLDLVVKRTAAYLAAINAGIARRARRAQDIKKELDGKPSPERRAELNAEFRALVAPIEDPAGIIEQGPSPFSSSPISKCVAVRDNLLASYLNANVLGESSLKLPALLAGNM